MNAPPFSMESEKAALGSVLIRNTAYDEVSSLVVAEDFVGLGHDAIFRAMGVLVAAGKPPGDVMLLIEEVRRSGSLGKLDGGEMYMLTLSGAVPTAENAVHYARIIRDKAVLRRVMAACAETIARASSNEAVGASAVLADHMAGFEAITIRGDRGSESYSDLGSRVLDVVEAKCKAPDGYQIPIGIKEFDEEYGGFRAGQFVLIGGRPGNFKTTFAVNTAVRMAMTSNISSLIFSLEMSKQELFEKMLAQISEVDSKKITRGTLDVAEWKSIHGAHKVLSKLPILIDDREDIAAEDLCSAARMWSRSVDAGGPPKMKAIWIDSMSQLSLRKEGRRFDDVSKISRMLKRLARSLGCPVFLVAHVNREVEKSVRPRKPRLSDLRESGSLEQDADVVLFPWITPGQSADVLDAHLLMVKVRDGVPSEVPVSIHRRCGAFKSREDSTFVSTLASAPDHWGNPE
jgi:replicative DNA helicase